MPDIDTLRPMFDYKASNDGLYPNHSAVKNGESSTSGRRASQSLAAGKEGDGEMKPTRKFPEEEDEDLLRESNDRFVLFPIKYREVSSCSKIVPRIRGVS